jgi:hypothetical protein
VEKSKSDSKPAGLRFDTSDDASNYAMKLIEDGNRWASRGHWSLVERYKNGNTYIHVDVFCRDGTHVGQLSFFAVPDGIYFGDVKMTYVSSATKPDVGICHSRFGKRSMDCSIPCLIESPEGAIPSFLRIVGFKGQEERSDGFGNLGTLTSEIVRGLVGSPPERKFCVLRVGFPAQDYCTVKNCVIETRSKAIDYIEEDSGDHVRHIGSEPRLEQDAPAFRISLSELGVGFFSLNPFSAVSNSAM